MVGLSPLLGGFWPVVGLFSFFFSANLRGVSTPNRRQLLGALEPKEEPLGLEGSTKPPGAKPPKVNLTRI